MAGDVHHHRRHGRAESSLISERVTAECAAKRVANTSEDRHSTANRQRDRGARHLNRPQLRRSRPNAARKPQHVVRSPSGSRHRTAPCTTFYTYPEPAILVDAGITAPPFLDWFHIAMRIQHAAQTAGGLPTDNPGRMKAKSVIVDEVERLRWRIWNGKAKNAKRSIDRVRKVMRVYKDERGQHTRSAPSRRLWHALLDVDRYLRGQSSWLINYAKRYRAGLRVGTSLTEGTANFLVNRRMNKSQQMRWSRRGADLLLQVRCAVYNGTLGSGLGHRFQPHANQNERLANAA